MIDKLHLLLPTPRPAGDRDAKQTIATAERTSRFDRDGRRNGEGDREAGRSTNFPEHVAVRQLAEENRGHARVERRLAPDRRASAQRQVLSDATRPQRRASDDYPISTFMALHIAQEVLPRSAIELDPRLYAHPGPALYHAAQASLAATPRALSLSA